MKVENGKSCYWEDVYVAVSYFCKMPNHNFWQGFEYASGSEYDIVLNMLGFYTES